MKKTILFLSIAVVLGTLAWCSTSTDTTNKSPVEETKTSSNTETINVWHTAFALDPETVILKAWKSYKLIVTPTENGWWCMYAMTIPGLDNNAYDIKKGVPITITINNAKAGSYDVVCTAMWMYQWSIIVQ